MSAHHLCHEAQLPVSCWHGRAAAARRTRRLLRCFALAAHSNKPKGFGKRPDGSADTDTGAALNAEELSVDLGVRSLLQHCTKCMTHSDAPQQRGKSLKLLRPRNLVDGGMLLFEAPQRELFGAGDVVWPATLALSRLVIHCPSFVAGLDILEMGAGLGLPSCAAAAAGARSVTVTDKDDELLLLARRSVTINLTPLQQQQPACSIHAVRADLTRLPGDWPSSPVDVVLASDVLYSDALAAAVADVIAHYLLAARPQERSRVLPRALIADPKQRQHRDVFAARCAALGLECQVTDLPGPEDCALLCVTPAA